MSIILSSHESCSKSEMVELEEDICDFSLLMILFLVPLPLIFVFDRGIKWTTKQIKHLLSKISNAVFLDGLVGPLE